MGRGSVNGAAELLVRSRLDRSSLSALPTECLPRDEEAAYVVQEAVSDLLIAAGLGKVAGYKVGLVTADIRLALGGFPALGVDSPVYAGIPRNCIYERDVDVAFGDFIRPYVEGEIAVRMGADVPPASPAYTRQTIANYVSDCHAAIELVDWRMNYLEFAPPLAPLMIADGGSNWGCVVGAPIQNWRSIDLATLHGSMRVNGRDIGGGSAAALQGHPFEVLAWLANKLIARGRTLREGDIVLLGSVTPSFGEFEAGAEVVMTWDTLGDVRVRFQ